MLTQPAFKQKILILKLTDLGEMWKTADFVNDS